MWKKRTSLNYHDIFRFVLLFYIASLPLTSIYFEVDDIRQDANKIKAILDSWRYPMLKLVPLADLYPAHIQLNEL